MQLFNGFCKKIIKGTFNKTKKICSNIFTKIFNPKKFLQNSIMSIVGLKPEKTKTQKAVEKTKNTISKGNNLLLKLTDKILALYNKYISGKPKKLWMFIKLVFKALISLLKKCWNKIVAFYKKDKKRAIIYFILLYVIYKLFIGFCGKVANIFHSNKNSMIVLTREVKPERITKDVNCYGYLESENTLNYQSEVRGNIDKILVQEKQMVQEGQLLMILDSKFTANSYTSTKSILESKRLQYNAIKKLFEEGLESRGNLKAMEADLQNATSNFESAKKAYNGLVIKAPFDGYIDNIRYKETSQVNPGQVLFTLERTNAMQVKCEVQNIKVEEVNIGDEAKIYVSGHEMAKGKISVIGDSVDVYSGARSVLVKDVSALEGYEEIVKPGVSVMMKIMAKAQQDVYKVSAEALELTQTGGFMVKTLNPDNGEISSKNVLIYDENNGINYLTGLKEGDYVVERGHEFVDVGEKNIQYTMVDNQQKTIFEKLKDYCGKIKKAVIETKNFIVNLPEFCIFIKDEIVDDYITCYNSFVLNYAMLKAKLAK